MSRGAVLEGIGAARGVQDKKKKEYFVKAAQRKALQCQLQVLGMLHSKWEKWRDWKKKPQIF